MRLVVIAAVERDLRPVHFPHAVDRLQHILKSPHPAEGLGSQTYLFAKFLDESPRAQPDFIRDGADSIYSRDTAETSQRKVYSAMQRKRASDLRQHHGFRF